ncbi:MAG: hypothetical protein ACLQUZ_17455 [Rhizomicrobium sp.]
MKKFVNHIDHVTWISRIENIEANVARLEMVTEAKLVRFERGDMGFVMYLNWEAGLEVVAPLTERTEFNQALYDRLESHGEGLLGIVFGVENLEKHKEKLEAKGLQIGPLMDDLPTSPWHHKIVLRERAAPEVINSWVVLGQIDYQDDVIRFEDV